MYMYNLVIINSDALLEGRCQLMFSQPLFMGLSVHASIIVIHFYLGSQKARLSPVQSVLNAAARMIVVCNLTPTYLTTPLFSLGLSHWKRFRLVCTARSA